MLTLLPDEFTHEDVHNLCIAQSMKPNPGLMTSNWELHGQIVTFSERGSHKKVNS